MRRGNKGGGRRLEENKGKGEKGKQEGSRESGEG